MNRTAVTALLVASTAASQQSPGTSVAARPSSPATAAAAPLANSDGARASVRDYVLGPGDLIAIAVPDLETEFTNKTFRVDMSGDVTIPFAGRLHAAGLSTAGLENEMRTRLARVLKDPEVVVSLSTQGSQPVSILGAVNSPGIRQIEGRKTLFEVLSLAGGLRPDAGYVIYITRDTQWGAIPLQAAQPDPTGRYSIASVRVKTIMNATDPSENILIFPGDTISVPKADVVYAVGSVTKPGGFLLNEHESLTALQVVSLAEGLQKTAAANKAKILRSTDGSQARTEIPVDLKLLLAGKAGDVQLRAGDILLCPTAAQRVLDTGLSRPSQGPLALH